MMAAIARFDLKSLLVMSFPKCAKRGGATLGSCECNNEPGLSYRTIRMVAHEADQNSSRPKARRALPASTLNFMSLC